MIESIEKAPRWFLVLICATAIGLCWVACGFVIKNAFADMDNTKKIAWQAKNSSDQNQRDISQFKDEFQRFRNEYREDQKDTVNKLEQLLRRSN